MREDALRGANARYAAFPASAYQAALPAIVVVCVGVDAKAIAKSLAWAADRLASSRATLFAYTAHIAAGAAIGGIRIHVHAKPIALRFGDGARRRRACLASVWNSQRER